MTTKTLSLSARTIIQQYLHLPFPQGTFSCPYFNNKHIRTRGNLRVLNGKGTPTDITTETYIIALREHIDIADLTIEQLRRFLIEHNIGIDCSGLAYYILDAELKATKQISLVHMLHYPKTNFLRKLIIQLRPVENTNVTIFADDSNSKIIPLANVQPGDMIIMKNTGMKQNTNHVLIIHQVDYKNTIPKKIYYTHTIQWSSDGKYNHGIRQGKITITDDTKPLTEQLWIEQKKIGQKNETLTHAKTAIQLEQRRLNKD